jgi:hypothetical protein
MPIQKTVGGIQCHCHSFLKFGIISLTIQYNTHKSFTARLEKIKRWREKQGYLDADYTTVSIGIIS